MSSNYSNSATLDIFESAETSSSLRFLLTTCMALGRPEKQGPVLSGSDYQVAISDHSSSSSKHTSAVSLSPTVGRRRDCRVAGNPKFTLPRKFAATTAEPEFDQGRRRGAASRSNCQNTCEGALCTSIAASLVTHSLCAGLLNHRRVSNTSGTIAQLKSGDGSQIDPIELALVTLSNPRPPSFFWDLQPPATARISRLVYPPTSPSALMGVRRP